MEYRLDQMTCAAVLPSVEQPLLDLTIVRQSAPPASARVLRGEGIAANGVADIGLEMT